MKYQPDLSVSLLTGLCGVYRLEGRVVTLQISDLDLMFDAHVSDRHLNYAEPFFDTFYPFVLTQCRQALRDGLEQ